MNGLQISIVILSVSFALFSFFLLVSVAGTATEGRRKIEKRVNKIADKKSGLTLQIQEKKKPVMTVCLVSGLVISILLL